MTTNDCICKIPKIYFIIQPCFCITYNHRNTSQYESIKGNHLFIINPDNILNLTCVLIIQTQNEEENRVRFQDGEESDRSPHLVPPKSKPFVGSTDEIQPLSNGEVVTPEIVEGKKKKKKKKKKRANKTAPAPDNDDDENIDKLPPLAWGTPPATLNGFPGSSGLGLRRLEPLGPLTGSKFELLYCV